VISFHRPDSLATALKLLAEPGQPFQMLAGGTALMLPSRRSQLSGRLVALIDVPELRGIRVDEAGSLRIGALTTHTMLASGQLSHDFCPALASAFGRVATVRVRNQGTVGGNLALADPAHDPPAILIALDACVLLARGDQRRHLAVEALATGPFLSALAPDEVIVEVRIPATAAQRVEHVKFIVRAGSFREQGSYPTVSCGVALELDKLGRCSRVRIGLTGVHRYPMRVRATEQALTGQTPTPSAIRAAARAVRADLDPLDDERGSPEYKREMAAVWIERALAKAVAQAPPSARRSADA